MSLEELGRDPLQDCKTLTSKYRTHVVNLERYKKEADAVIAAQERKLVDVKQEKKSFPWVHVTISVLIGALTGVILL